MPLFSVLGVGAIYEDIILTVPQFPAEDSKLRATSRISRLGGNVPNTLDVLSQILVERNPDSDPTLLFVGALSDKKSSSFLKDELEKRHIRPFIANREDCRNPPTAYVLESAAASTRTIISYNEISDLSLDELTDLVLKSKLSVSDGRAETRPNPSWIHFEGRNCHVVGDFLSSIHTKLSREHSNGDPATNWDGMVSIDFERPGRAGLRELFCFADVAFISSSYVKSIVGWMAVTPTIENLVEYFTDNIKRLVKKEAIYYITLGEGGCFLIIHEKLKRNYPGVPWANHASGLSSTRIKASDDVSPGSVVETTGAGDTFIAAVIFGLGALKLDPVQAGKLGNKVAGRKCLQKGFEGVWKGIDQFKT